MRQKLLVTFLILITFTVSLTLFPVNVRADVVITSNQTGTHGGYNFEYWKDTGTDHGPQRRWCVQLRMEQYQQYSFP